MSNSQVGRVLNIIVCAVVDVEAWCHAVMDLGHNVLDSCSTLPDLLTAILNVGPVPDLIVTDLVDTVSLQSIHTACVSRIIAVPFLVVGDNLENLSMSPDLSFIFGVCKEPSDLRYPIFIAIVQFRTVADLRAQLKEREQELAEKSIIHQACGILERFGLASPGQGYDALRAIATSWSGTTMYNQALAILRGAESMQPKPKN